MCLRVILFLGLALEAQAQMYLITGSFAEASPYRFPSLLFAVGNDGKVTQKETLVSQTEFTGFYSIGINYELKRAMIPASQGADDPLLVRVLDFEKARVTKECQMNRGIGWEHWLGYVPGHGATLLMFYLGTDFRKDPGRLYGFSGDPAVRCENSVRPMLPRQIGSATPLGTAGVGMYIMRDGYTADADPLGNVTRFIGGGSNATLDFKLPDDLRPEKYQRIYVHSNNSRIRVVSLYDDQTQRSRLIVLRKRDGAWLAIPERLSALVLRAFGRYVAITEAHIKKSRGEAQGHLRKVDLNDNAVREGLGAMEKVRGFYMGLLGPPLYANFADSPYVYPGRLHIFDSDTGEIFTIDTDEADSEILLIDNGTIYYRTSDELYAAPLTTRGIGRARLLTTNDVIAHAHWAFVKH